MKKIDLSAVIQSVRKEIVKKSPDILFALGIGGIVSTVITAVAVTPKAMKLIEEKKKEQLEIPEEETSEDNKEEKELPAEIEKLPAIEIVKTTWKCYVPVAVTGAFSIACLFGARSIRVKRNAVLATAYGLSEAALLEYKDKVVETIGEKKEEVIRNEIVEDRVKKNPVKDNEVILTEQGDTLCYDVISGRYFRSDIEKIRKIENELNKRLMNEMYVSLNEFYYELGIRATKIGNELGWNLDDGLIDLHFSSVLTEDDTPCLAVDYHIAPRYGYAS